MNLRGVVFDGMTYYAPSILAAWRKRGDWKKRDGLWEAACWAESGLSRRTDQGKVDDFDRAENIVSDDPEAWFAMWMVLPAIRVAAPRPDRRASSWPSAKRGVWR